MARYNNTPKPLSALLENFVEAFPARTKLKRGMILSVFKNVVGPRIHEQVHSVWFKDDVLFVKVHNQAWRHELHFQRESIRYRLNRRVKEDIIAKVIILS